MIISSQFFIETHVYLNHFSRDKFKNLDVDNKMSLSCGWEEPHSWPKNAFFIGVMSIYFVTFFLEHSVFYKIIIWISYTCLLFMSSNCYLNLQWENTNPHLLCYPTVNPILSYCACLFNPILSNCAHQETHALTIDDLYAELKPPWVPTQ